MREDVFLNTPEGRESTPDASSPAHACYKLSEQFELDGLRVGIVVRFSQGELTAVSLFVATGAQSWGEWSEAEELGNQARFEQLLTAKYGNNRSLGWGSLAAEYDPRSGSAALAIRYI
jgi:hypothetical protein